MNRRRIVRVVPAALALILVILVSRGVALSAASGNPFDEVVEKLNQIIEILAPSVAVPPGPVTLATSALFIPDTQLAFCSVTNVGTAPVPVTFRLFGEGQIALLGPINGTVDPGEISSINFIGGGFRRCEFTVVGTSVRAALVGINLADAVTTASDAAR